MFLAASISWWDDVIIPALLLLLIVLSQIFWIRRVRDLGRAWIKNLTVRHTAWAVCLAYYAVLWIYAFSPIWSARERTPVRLTAASVLLDAPYQVWLFGSVVGFLLVVLLRLPAYAYRGARWLVRLSARAWPKKDSANPAPARTAGAVDASRRGFLESATVVAGLYPFAAGFYGLVRGRLEIETTRYRVELANLPRGFEGFRVAQLSDVHIGPFMTAAQIRSTVDSINQLRPDVILLTGDYVIWDPTTAPSAVDALSSLRAPYGVFACLGNHEMWARVGDIITGLFTAQGTRVLRSQSATLRAPGGDELNLMGVDFQTHHPMGAHAEGIVHKYLEGIEPMIRRDTANILMSHNPNTFDRAAELGIELSLAGHTHGGQVALEFISPQISPSRLVTPYVWGWFTKPGGKLYVNRGLGTIGIPMRMGAAPEITLYELTKQA